MVVIYHTLLISNNIDYIIFVLYKMDSQNVNMYLINIVNKAVESSANNNNWVTTVKTQGSQKWCQK